MSLVKTVNMVLFLCVIHCVLSFGTNRFFSKAKKAAMTPLAPPPAPPTVPRLVEDVVPDDRDDPEIILSTTTVRPPHIYCLDRIYESVLTLLLLAVFLLCEDLRWSGALLRVGGLGHP